MGIGFAATVASRRHLHQSGIQLILQIALEHSPFDQGRALSRRTLVVHVQRSASIRQGAIIHHGTQRRGHPLTDPTAEGRSPLAVEIALQAVADRLMQQNARPARPQYHGHGTGRRGYRVQVDQRQPHRFSRVFQRAILVEEPTVGDPAAAAAGPLFATPLLFDDHRHIQTHQRSHIASQDAIATRHQDRILGRGQADHHLGDTWILAAGLGIHPFEQMDLGLGRQRLQRIERFVQDRPAGRTPHLKPTIATPEADHRHRAGRWPERRSPLPTRPARQSHPNRQNRFSRRLSRERRHPAGWRDWHLSPAHPPATTIQHGVTENTNPPRRSRDPAGRTVSAVNRPRRDRRQRADFDEQEQRCRQS